MTHGKINLVYILSPSYSGSTLLTLLLDQNPDIGTIGELKGSAMGNVNEYLCSCGDRIVQCSFWQRIKKLAKVNGLIFDVHDYKTKFSSESRILSRFMRMTVKSNWIELLRSHLLFCLPGYVSAVNSIIDRNVGLMKLILQEQGAKIFLDGSKDARRLVYFLQSPKFAVKVVRIVRDGRGVSCSFKKNDGLPFSSAIQAWSKSCFEIDRVCSMLTPAQLKVVSYEALCKHTSELMSDIFQFVGCDDISVQHQLPFTSSHIIGNRMRLNCTSEVRLDESWRQKLSTNDLKLFNDIAGSLNNAYGYR